MYSSPVLSEAKQPTAQHLDLADRLAQEIQNYSPELQNEMVERIIAVIAGDRKRAIEETKFRLDHLQSTDKYLSGLCSVGIPTIK